MEYVEQDKDWDLVIKGHSSLLDLKFGDLWRYRDLLLMFVKRDFVSFYKQTILGDRKSTRLNSSHVSQSRMPSSA